MAHLVSRHPVAKLYGQAATEAELLQLCRQMGAGIAVLDLVLSNDYLQMLRALAAMEEPPKVIVLTSLSGEHDVRACVQAGVKGYLLKTSEVEEVSVALQVVAEGRRHLSMAIAHKLADGICREELTPRELRVLQLIAQGRNNMSIGQELGIAMGTVKTHVRSILEKLESQSRTEAVNVAIQRGLLHRED